MSNFDLTQPADGSARIVRPTGQDVLRLSREGILGGLVGTFTNTAEGAAVADRIDFTATLADANGRAIEASTSLDLFENGLYAFMYLAHSTTRAFHGTTFDSVTVISGCTLVGTIVTGSLVLLRVTANPFSFGITKAGALVAGRATIIMPSGLAFRSAAATWAA